MPLGRLAVVAAASLLLLALGGSATAAYSTSYSGRADCKAAGLYPVSGTGCEVRHTGTLVKNGCSGNTCTFTLDASATGSGLTPLGKSISFWLWRNAGPLWIIYASCDASSSGPSVSCSVQRTFTLTVPPYTCVSFEAVTFFSEREPIPPGVPSPASGSLVQYVQACNA